ncbi:MAG: hypothetical protein ACTS85_00960 [Arsenophonus sp. NC-PG7-MAG3]
MSIVIGFSTLSLLISEAEQRWLVGKTLNSYPDNSIKDNFEGDLINNIN